MGYTFILLLLGHTISDFYINTRTTNLKSGTIYALLLTILLASFATGNLQHKLIIGLILLATHILLNKTRFALERKLKHKKEINFILSTLYHLIFVAFFILLAYFYPTENSTMITWKECLIVFLFLFLIKPSSEIISFVMNFLNLNSNVEDLENSKIINQETKHKHSAGEIIGYLERVIIGILGLLNELGVISLLLTAKTLVRYGQLSHDTSNANDAQGDKLTPNKYLIGTLLSILIGLIAALIMKKTGL